MTRESPENSEIYGSSIGQPTAADSDRSFLAAVIAYGLRLHRSLKPSEVALDAVNDGLALVGCERLTIATRQGRRFRIIAISGQDRVVTRSESIRRLRRLIDRAAVVGRPIVYSGDLRQVESPLADAMAYYLEESRSRMVAIVPLAGRRRRRSEAGRHTHGESKDLRPYGVLIAEMFASSLPPQGMPRRCRLVADQIESALAAAQRHDRIPFLRVFTAVGTLIHLLRGFRLALAVVVGLLLSLSVATLCLVPATYRAPCSGILMPSDRCYVYAPLDAKIVDIRVKDREDVEAGDVLMILESETLSAEYVTAQSAVSEQRKLVEALDTELRQVRLGQVSDESLRLQGELTRAEISLQGAIEKLTVVQERFELLTIRAPNGGAVAGFRLSERLLNRPVNRGQRLFSIVRLDGPWRLELDLEEHRAGPVSESLAHSESTLPVNYILATDVGTTRRASLQSLATRVDHVTDGTYALQAIATVDDRSHESRYVGAEVYAKIDCGEQPLGYVLFGDVIDFLRRKLWF